MELFVAQTVSFLKRVQWVKWTVSVDDMVKVTKDGCAHHAFQTVNFFVEQIAQIALGAVGVVLATIDHLQSFKNRILETVWLHQEVFIKVAMLFILFELILKHFIEYVIIDTSIWGIFLRM